MKISLSRETASRPDRYFKKNNFVYLPMQKNASSWGIDFFSKLGWEEVIFSNHIDSDAFLVGKKVIVFLREPIKRWYSAVAQYFDLLDYTSRNEEYILDDKVLDLIFSAVRIDGHSDLQIKWLLGLNIEDCVFFNMDTPMFEYNLHRFLHQYKLLPNLPLISNFEAGHTSDNHVMKVSIINQLQKYAQQNTKLLTNINHFYIPDKQLYNWLVEKNIFFDVNVEKENKERMSVGKSHARK